MQVHPGDPFRSRRRQSEVAVYVHVRFVGAHKLADPGQDRGQRSDVLFDEDEDGRLVSLDGPEFQQGLVVAGGVEPDRDVFGPVPVDEEDSPKQGPLGICESGRRGEEVAAVEFLQPLRLLSCCTLRRRAAIAVE